MNILKLFGVEPKPIHAPAPEPTGITPKIDWLYPTPEAKENLLKEVEGLRLAIRLMGLDPEKVVKCLSREENYTYNSIMFSSLRPDDQALIDGGANEKALPAYKSAYNTLKPNNKSV